jgi:outer membrane lipoprotein SlyB
MDVHDDDVRFSGEVAGPVCAIAGVAIGTVTGSIVGRGAPEVYPLALMTFKTT